jgi:uncharacterized protein
MDSKDYVETKEVYIKTDRIQGNMVILKESEDDSHYFLMFVGDAEITAIAKEKGLVEPKRPLTHDLYLAILEKAGVVFDRIEILVNRKLLRREMTTEEIQEYEAIVRTVKF